MEITTKDVAIIFSILVTLIGLVAWFVRLEAANKANTKSIDVLYGQDKDKEKRLREIENSTSGINQKLSGIETAMSNVQNLLAELVGRKQ